MKKLPPMLFQALLTALNKHRYCFLRNYDDLPYFRNDLDILVDGRSKPQLISEIISTFGALDVKLIHAPEFSCSVLYFLESQSHTIYQLDLFTSLSWRGLAYLDANQILRCRRRLRDFFIPAPEDELCELMLNRLIYQKKIHAPYRNKINQLLEKHPEAVSQRLRFYFDSALADNLEKSIENQEWKVIEKKRRRILQALFTSALTSRFGETRRGCLDFIARVSERWFHPPGVSLALFGQDQGRKARLVEQLTRQFAQIYPHEKIQCLAISARGICLGEDCPSGQRLEEQENSKSLSLRQAILGWKNLFKDGLLILDFPHPTQSTNSGVKHGLELRSLTQFFGRLVPGPNLSVFTDIPKGGVEVKTLQSRRLGESGALPGRILEPRIINERVSLEELYREVGGALISLLTQRLSGP